MSDTQQVKGLGIHEVVADTSTFCENYDGVGKEPTRAELEKAAYDAEDERILKAFGVNLRRAMAEAGYEKDLHLARASGVHNANIGRYKAGDQEAGLTKIVRLARALGIPVGDLFRDPEAERSPSLDRALRARERGQEIARGGPEPSPPGRAPHSRQD